MRVGGRVRVGMLLYFTALQYDVAHHASLHSYVYLKYSSYSYSSYSALPCLLIHCQFLDSDSGSSHLGSGEVSQRSTDSVMCSNGHAAKGCKGIVLRNPDSAVSICQILVGPY